MMNNILTGLVALAAGIIVLTVALAFGVFLEQGGKSEEDDYDDE